MRSGRHETARGHRAALAPKPDIPLMDEPFGVLNAQTRVLLQEGLPASSRTCAAPSRS